MKGNLNENDAKTTIEEGGENMIHIMNKYDTKSGAHFVFLLYRSGTTDRIPPFVGVKGDLSCIICERRWRKFMIHHTQMMED